MRVVTVVAVPGFRLPALHPACVSRTRHGWGSGRRELASAQSHSQSKLRSVARVMLVGWISGPWTAAYYGMARPVLEPTRRGRKAMDGCGWRATGRVLSGACATS